MAIPYSKRMLVQRIRKHMADGYPNDDFSASTNEIMLYVDQALAMQIRAAAYENAKVEGVLEVPEAFLVTFQLDAPVYDDFTNEWVSTLPQTPISLPIGYSINSGYIADVSNGRSQDIIWIKGKRIGYRRNLPKMDGIYGRVENNTVRLQASNYMSLLGLNIFIQMPFSRTKDLDEPMALPDDVIDAIFMRVVTMLKDRMSIPKDIILDDLPAGNKSS